MGANKNLTDPSHGALNWDTPLNANFDNIDQGFGGTQLYNLAGVSGTVNVSSGSFLGAYPANAASFVPLYHNVSGAMAGNVLLQIPNGVGGLWVIRNVTSGGTLSIQNASGAAALVLPGGVRTIQSDGFTVFLADVQVAGSSNQIQYNASGAFAGNSNLTFDGTNLSVGGGVTAGGVVAGAGVTSSAGITASSGNIAASSGTVTGTNLIVSSGHVTFADSSTLSTAPTANSLLPSQSGASGKFLTSNGSNTSWSSTVYPAAVSLVTNGTSNPSVTFQYNVTSVVRTGVGNWTITFTNALNNTSYYVITGGIGVISGFGPVPIAIGAKGTTTLTLVWINNSSSAADPTGTWTVDIVILGGL